MNRDTHQGTKWKRPITIKTSIPTTQKGILRIPISTFLIRKRIIRNYIYQLPLPKTKRDLVQDMMGSFSTTHSKLRLRHQWY